MIKISDIYDDEDRTIEIMGLKFHWPFPIAFMLHSSGATVFGFRAYGGGKRPIINRIRRAFEGILDIKYAFMYRFIKKHQYHAIHTDLGYGYHCSDDRILWGAMKCLEDYVEAGKHGGEKGLEEHINDMRTNPDPNAPDGLVEDRANSDAEALSIYRWWKKEKPADEKLLHEMIMALYGRVCKIPQDERKEYRQRLWDLKAKIESDEQSYLHRLIDIRLSLWI